MTEKPHRSLKDQAAQDIAATIVKVGWRPSQLAQDPTFVANIRLLMPKFGHTYPYGLDLVLAFLPTVEAALKLLGDNPFGEAAWLLTGLHDRTRNYLSMHRVSEAARAMGYQEDYFRTKRRPEIVEALGIQIYEATSFPGAA